MIMAHPVNIIHRVSKPGKKPYLYYPVAVVGAGESGICVGARLQQVLGCDQFRIFDRRASLGGTWYTNTYPGIACDVPAILYSYSFAQNPDWTGVLPPGNEILSYLYNVCAKFKLLDKIQCDTNVKSVTWIEEDEEWQLVLETLAPGIGDMSSAERLAIENEKGVGATVLRTELARAKVVVSACGGLVEPKPNLRVPGIESFQGKIVHTARWDPTIELKDKNVVVLGTGCSAAQVVPKLITPEIGPAKHVTQLLRSPPWTVPFLNDSGKKTFAQWTSAISRLPGGQEVLRKLGFSFAENEWYSLFALGSKPQDRRKVKGDQLVAYMKRVVPEEYHDILTPNYELFCKRRIVDDGWFKSFRDPRVDITSQPLTAVGPDTITLGPGRHYPPESVKSNAPTEQRQIPCDVLILANGYQTNEWLHPLQVNGRHASLHETWKNQGGAQAYHGLAMDGFPNFFMVPGPNMFTAHSSVILASENLTNYTLKLIKPILNSEVSTIEVKQSAQRKWTDNIQAELKQSLYSSANCYNWYNDPSTGWNSMVYPRSQIDISLRCMFPVWNDWMYAYTRKGLLKFWIKRFLRFVLYLSLITGVVVWRRLGRQGIKDYFQDLSDSLKSKAINLAIRLMQ